MGKLKQMEFLKSDHTGELRLIEAKKLCFTYRSSCGMSVSEALKWILSDEGSFELKEYCLRKQDLGPFNSSKNFINGLLVIH